MKTQNLIKRNLTLFVLLLFSSISFSQTIFADEKAIYDGVKRLEVKGSFCDVEIIGGEINEVQLEGIIKGSYKKRKEFTIHHKLNGGTLNVWIDSPNNYWGNIQGELKFIVPEDIEVEVKNSSGDLYCEGIVSDYTRLRASSGDIDIKRLKGELEVTTSSGEISIKEIVGNLTVQSSSGDQEIKSVVGNINTEATSGDLEFKEIKGDISSRTSSGDLEIDQLEGRLKNVSTSGNLEISNSNTVLHLTASSGDIEGQNLVLVGESFFNTTSGNVSLDLKNDFEQLSFDLSASSGNLTVENRRADDKLYVKKGEIWIHGKSSSGNQSYR